MPPGQVSRALIWLMVLAALCPAKASGARAHAARIATTVAPPAHAPTRAPLLGDGQSAPTVAAAEEPQQAGAEGEADPLVDNGLASPACKGVLAGELPASSRRDCETSGFIAAPAPTGDYGLDVHIDTGLVGFNSAGLQSTVQDLVIGPLWTLLVWVTHTLVVTLEWCFTIDLLDSSAAGALARGLRHAQASFTQPWLVLALACAAVCAAYQGLVRRRVADTLGEVLLMAAMIVAGLSVIADPSGTVGALGQWINSASLGTEAVAGSGTPASPARSFDVGLNTVFASAIEGPWCYLEFGNVGWCENPARLQPSLRIAALAIARSELSRAHCASGSGCASEALRHSARLLQEAHSNGEIFLALPANDAPRNSINDEGSLLRTLCESSEATNCHGASAAQAEFRTGGHTWARLSGLALICAGVLGMLLLMGFLALRLLAAAIFSLLYLLLAPIVVLAPAFGESGRAVFRRWAARMVGAVVSKLLFAFLLGVVLAVLTLLSELTALGWWTQWLLMTAFWWGAFMRRHDALAFIEGKAGKEGAPRRSVLRRVGGAFDAHRQLSEFKRRRERGSEQPPTPEPARLPSPKRTQTHHAARLRPSQPGERGPAHSQARRSLAVEHGHALQRKRDAQHLAHALAGMRARLHRVREQQALARGAGDHRRSISLLRRGAQIEGAIERERRAQKSAARITAVDADANKREHARERFLDAQAALPGSAQRARAAGEGEQIPRRDYRRLASLAGYSQEAYEQLDPQAERKARLKIDRELALRSEIGQRLGGATRMLGEPSGEPPVPRTHARAERDPIDPELLRASLESPVMRDAFEVSAGRKRQLGPGRP